jgi:hypothetical protein
MPLQRMLKSVLLIPAALSLVLVLTACGASTGLGSKGRLDFSNAPVEPVAGCKGVGILPERDLSRAEVEALWEIDRTRLSKCFPNVKALLAYIAVLKAEAAKAPRVKS